VRLLGVWQVSKYLFWSRAHTIWCSEGAYLTGWMRYGLRIVCRILLFTALIPNCPILPHGSQSPTIATAVVNIDQQNDFVLDMCPERWHGCCSGIDRRSAWECRKGEPKGLLKHRRPVRVNGGHESVGRMARGALGGAPRRHKIIKSNLPI